MDPAMVPLNRSLDVDLRIWRQDIRVSLAWVSALAGADVLTLTEGDMLDPEASVSALVFHHPDARYFRA